jgi:hypothetical protein
VALRAEEDGMRRLALAMALLVPGSSAAFVRTTTQSSTPSCPGGQAKPLYWNVLTVPYVKDQAGTPDVTDESAFAAVDVSFQHWQDVACSYVSFQNNGKLANAPVGFSQGGSNVNVVKFIESDWTHSARAIAVTLTTFDCNTGEIFDADIVLNGVNFSFTTSPMVGVPRADVENTVTHEAGHLLGFDHDPNPESTMYADAPLGETRKRTLSEDDVTGLCHVYNETAGRRSVCTNSRVVDGGVQCVSSQVPGTKPGGGGCSACESVGGSGAGLALLCILSVALVTRRGVRSRV